MASQMKNNQAVLYAVKNYNKIHLSNMQECKSGFMASAKENQDLSI